jgi:hypothetical protein
VPGVVNALSEFPPSIRSRAASPLATLDHNPDRRQFLYDPRLTGSREGRIEWKNNQ